MKSKIEKVKFILDYHQETRNSDKDLLFKYYQQYFNKEAFEMLKSGSIKGFYQFIKIIDNPDEIIRIRRKFNQKGLYLPTDENVKQERFKKECKIRKDLGYNPEMSQPIK